MRVAELFPSRKETFKLGTWVVEVTESGAVPVATVEMSWVPWTVPVATRLPLTVSNPSLLIERSSVRLFLIERSFAPAVA